MYSIVSSDNKLCCCKLMQWCSQIKAFLGAGALVTGSGATKSKASLYSIPRDGVFFVFHVFSQSAGMVDFHSVFKQGENEHK